MSSHVTGVATPESGFGPECIISRQDLELLLRGTESERETGYRNLCAAVAGSSGFGIASTVVSSFEQLATAGVDPLQSIFLILLAAVTLAAGFLAVFFHRRLRASSTRDAHHDLQRQIRERLAGGGVADNACHWP